MIEIKGANAEAYCSQLPELILCGPSRCGKTFAILHKLQYLALTYPDLRILVVRKTRVSMNDSVLETFETKIYPQKYLDSQPIDVKYRSVYHYPNKSRIHILGMDAPEKVLGSEWDIVYANECHELSEKEFDSIAARLLRHKGPFNQMIADCNPPTLGKEHWVWKRHERGGTKLFFSNHELNPTVTESDLKRLSGLRGDLKRRFFDGSWDAIPGEGKLFKAEWFNNYIEVMPKGGKWARGWDIAAGESLEADESAGCLMGVCDVDGKKDAIVIADVTAGRWSPHARNERMRLCAQSDSAIEATGYFEKGFGIGTDMTLSIIKALEGYSMWPIKPKGSKLFRADPFAAEAQAGNVYLLRGDWNYSFIMECAEFTGEEGGRDNKVDAASLAYKMLRR